MNNFVINNIGNFVQPIKLYHPDDPRYFNYWLGEKKKVIEGLWAYDERGWRYMPPKLYFFGNHGWITIVDEKQNVTTGARPELWDLMWMYGYESFESLGFSGFLDDHKYTCNKNILEYVKGSSNRFPTDNLFKPDGTLKEYVNPREYMYALHDNPLGVPLYENAPQNYLIGGSRGGGKALKHGSIVYTEQGTKKIEETEIGDKIFGGDGKLTNVTGVFPQGKVPLYKITFRSGRTVECCENHLWQVNAWDAKYCQIVDTKTIASDFVKERKVSSHNTKGKEYKYRVPVNGAIELPEKDLPLDPYLVGCLIGDGHISNNYSNKLVTLTTHVTDLNHYLENITLPCNVKYRIHQKKGTDNYTVCFGHTLSDALKLSKNGGHIYHTFQELGMAGVLACDKHIPEIYKQGSIAQRYRLLQGLMDTDGYITKRNGSNDSVYITTCSSRLAHDIADVVRSLGIPCGQPRFYTNKCKEAWDVIMYPMTNEVFSLPRKKDYVPEKTTNRQLSRYKWDYIINVEKVPDDYATCIMVDNEDHLFLTDNYVVTHNSFYLGIAEALHEIVTDGIKYYTPENIKSPPTIKVVIGSGDTSKSSELVAKVKDGMDALATRPELGVWGDISDEDYEPSPLYKNMVGDLTPNNIDNPWRHEYKALVKGREITKGTKTRLHHVSYSEMKGKKKGGQAAAGTRTTLSIVEEGGLTTLLEDAYKSNDATIRIGTRYFGRMVFAGTSENIEVVQPFKTLFSKPKQYRILSRPDNYENTGTEIAMFLPCYLTDRTFKDKNGNTNIEEAVDFYKKIREEKAKAEDPDLLRKEKMNYPLVPSEMWLSSKGSFLPSEELSIREKQLATNSHYLTLETCVKLYWDSTKPRGVGYDILHDAEPYRSFPHDEGKLRNPEGCVVIYDFPQEINGQIPPDLYSLIGHDPHGDGKEPGSSVASTYIVMNPKYAGSPYNLRGNCIVAAYNGKPKGGLDEYYEIQEKLISFYGNPPMGLMYERNKGADCRAHYIKKHKLHLLAPTPQFGQGTSMDYKTIRDFGYYTGAANFGKPSMAKHIHDWLLEWTELSDNHLDGGKKQNWERIPDIYLVRQMMQYDMEGNFDAVDGFRGCILALREYQIKLQSENKDKTKKTTTFQGLLNNQRIFQKRLNGG